MRALLEAAGRHAGCSAPSRRSSAAVSGRSSAPRPRRSTCSATLARDARRRRRRLRDGGLLACARAAPRRRDPLGRRGLHEPHPGPPRLPPDDGGLLRWPSAGCSTRGPRVAVVNVDDEYGRRLAADVPDAVTFAIERDASYRAPESRSAPPARRFTALDAGGPMSRSPLPGRFNVAQRARRASRPRARWASPRDADRARRSHGRPRARPLRAGRRGPGLRGARRLRAHARLAGQRAARPRASSPTGG